MLNLQELVQIPAKRSDRCYSVRSWPERASERYRRDPDPKGAFWRAKAKSLGGESAHHLAKDLVSGRADQRSGQRCRLRGRVVSTKSHQGEQRKHEPHLPSTDHDRDSGLTSQLIVIASIHQPSTSTFNLFDKVHLLAKGQLCYAGPIVDVASHFLSLGFKLPKYTNPAEWLLELVDTDFSPDQAAGRARLHRITLGWDAAVRHDQSSSTAFAGTDLYLPLSQSRIKYTRSFTLVHRMWLKSYRDILAYWIRVAMYTCKSLQSRKPQTR